jgi:molybdenum cofactor cytidylyltransferase
VKIAGVVLAAGASTRLGRAKQEIVLDEATGETLVERAVRVAVEAGLSPVVVVVRPAASFVKRLQGCVVVMNEQADEGMASSIRCGIRALHDVVGAVVMTCDQVQMRAAHLEQLCAEPERVTGSRYAGRVGVPAYFPAAVFAELMKLQGDVGARELLREAATIADEDLALDIDTEADVERARASSRELRS